MARDLASSLIGQYESDCENQETPYFDKLSQVFRLSDQDSLPVNRQPKK
jgi:hypothetical protein